MADQDDHDDEGTIHEEGMNSRKKRSDSNPGRFTGCPGGTIITRRGGLSEKSVQEFNESRLDRWKKWIQEKSGTDHDGKQ